MGRRCNSHHCNLDYVEKVLEKLLFIRKLERKLMCLWYTHSPPTSALVAQESNFSCGAIKNKEKSGVMLVGSLLLF